MKHQSAEAAVSAVNSGDRVFIQGGAAIPVVFCEIFASAKIRIEQCRIGKHYHIGSDLFSPESVVIGFLSTRSSFLKMFGKSSIRNTESMSLFF